MFSESEEENGGDLDHVGQVVSDLIMWKDASKSTFWFGFCSLCLLSLCFTQGLNFRSVKKSKFFYFNFQCFVDLVAIADSLIGCFVFLSTT